MFSNLPLRTSSNPLASQRRKIHHLDGHLLGKRNEIKGDASCTDLYDHVVYLVNAAVAIVPKCTRMRPAKL
jgi:hypothetical protein